MADLKSIFGGEWVPPVERSPEPPEVQLRQAIMDAGLEPPEEIILDGKVRRFRSGTKGQGSAVDKPGWYVGFMDGIPAGRFGCWRAGVEVTWRADVGRTLSPSDEMAHALRMSEAKAARDAELKLTRQVASDTVSQIWANAGAASPEHPYLKRKGIQPHGARVTGDGRLIVPLYNKEGDLSSLQYIDSEGAKKYHPGAATGGTLNMIGSADEPGPVYVAEGFATAATIHEVTGRPCAVAYSAGNLPAVTGTMRERFGAAQDIVIVADNDASDVGRRYAEQASAKHGARYVMPPDLGDANDYHVAGGDLLGLMQPQRDDWLVSADEFSAQPAPIAWLIKGWLQKEALIMIHGPSGGGKTFVVLDMCMRIAGSLSDWMGRKTHDGTVVYLAGEGHHGLRGRVAAWKHYHGEDTLDMWVSRDGCDLNTPEGYMRVVDHVRQLRSPPQLIVVDTLHRFLHGDENSAQDAKTMLDACGALIKEFRCSVVLVHHTGVSDEAQHRARGSSAWRGALDIEISVVPSKNERPIEIVQRKMKDGEMLDPVYAELHSVPIPGWIDEDGEQVSSAVLVESDAPPDAPKKDSKLTRHKKMLEAAWWAFGREQRDGRPYLSRSAFKEYLKTNLQLSESSIVTYIKPSREGKPIADLMLGGVIQDYEHGWIVMDDVMASSMFVASNNSLNS